MQSSQDPFDESVNDLRELLAKVRGIRDSVGLKGPIDRDVVVEVKDILQAATDGLGILNNVLQIIDQRNGKVGAHVFSVNEVLHRQRIVRDLETELGDMYGFRDIVESRLEDMEAKARATASVLNFDGSDNDAFLMDQEVTQREEHAQQDILLDRLAYGLQELRETGVSVNDEIRTQEVLLDETERDVEGVQARLRIANAKVDKLLANMSNKGKICTIVGLTLLLLFLALFVFG